LIAVLGLNLPFVLGRPEPQSTGHDDNSGILVRNDPKMHMSAPGRLVTTWVNHDELSPVAKQLFDPPTGVLAEKLFGDDRIAADQQENFPGLRTQSPTRPVS